MQPWPATLDVIPEAWSSMRMLRAEASTQYRRPATGSSARPWALPIPAFSAFPLTAVHKLALRPPTTVDTTDAACITQQK